ncbi:MAG: response regulator transcription factor [Pseudomonadota bacterium]
MLLGLLLGVLVLLALRMQMPAPWDRGQAWLLLALLLGWSWLLRQQPARWRALWQDRQRGRVATVHGSSVVLPQRGIGWFAPLRYQLLVAEQLFAADGVELPALRPGQSVSVRFLPASHVLLAVQLAPTTADNGDATPDIVWTPRERELLSRLAAGQSDKVIARECGLSPATVRTYNSAIFRKLGVKSRQQAVQAARQAGLLVVD